MKEIPKIGKRGWGGVCMFVFCVFMFFNANQSGQEYLDRLNEQGGVVRYATVTEFGGSDKFKDYMAQRDRESALFFMLVGIGCVVSGYWKYGRRPKAPVDEKLTSVS